MIDAAIRTLETSDGHVLRFRHWKAETSGREAVRGIVVATHGIQSHSGWYFHSSRAMAAAGFDVYFADRRGSGLNERDRGHADHALRLINDLRQLIQLARSEHSPGVALHTESGRAVPPLTLMGISWGGKIAAAAAAVLPGEINRLALLYPGLEPLLRPSRFQRLQLRFAKDFDLRRKVVSIPLRDPALFTDNPRWQEFIRNDKLSLHAVTSGFLNAGIDLDRLFHDHAGQVTQPILLMLAGRDQIIDNTKTCARINASGSRHVTTIRYPTACHTLEFDRDRELFIRELTDWLRQEL